MIYIILGINIMLNQRPAIQILKMSQASFTLLMMTIPDPGFISVQAKSRGGGCALSARQ